MPYVLLFALLDEGFINLTILGRQLINRRPADIIDIDLTGIRQLHHGSIWSRLDRFYNQDLSSPAESPKYVGANLGPTHERAWSCDVRRGSMQRLLGEAVRPVRQCRTAKSDERSPGRDLVRAGARRVALGSAGHLERLQTSRRRRENNRKWLEGDRVWR